LDIRALDNHRKETGSIVDFPEGKTIKNTGEALEMACDILIPAALENQINLKNAHNIKAKIIAEGANGPTTFAAEEILEKKGLLILPDMFLNAGGVTVSYFEWLKNLSHVRFGRMDRRYMEGSTGKMLDSIEMATDHKFDKAHRHYVVRGADEIDLVNSGLEDTMIGAYHEIRETLKKDGNIPNLRTAAFVNGINKVATSYLELGIFP